LIVLVVWGEVTVSVAVSEKKKREEVVGRRFARGKRKKKGELL